MARRKKADTDPIQRVRCAIYTRKSTEEGLDQEFNTLDAHCGGSMGPTFTTKNGKIYRYYLCVQASKRGYKECPVRTVAAGIVETAVVDQLRAVFKTPELVAQTYRAARSRETCEVSRLREEKSGLEDRLRSLKEKAANLVKADGIAGAAISEDLRRVGIEMDDVKSRLEAVGNELSGLETIELTENDAIDALGKLDPVWEELFPAEQARIIQLLVERVEVHPDGIEVELRGDGLHSLVAEIGADEPEEEAL